MENEKRLIDANALAKKLKKHHDFYVEAWGGFKNLPPDTKARVDEISACWAEIYNEPIVDAVEVVRCKDCKHWHEETGWCNQHSHFIGEKGEACHPWESNDWKMLNEDDFCSYGERKDNESTDH